MTQQRIALFMPWCLVKQAVTVGPMVLIPFHNQGPQTLCTPAESEVLHALLAPYQTPYGSLLPGWTVVRRVDKAIIDTYTDVELDEVFEFAEIVKFSALCARDLTDLDDPHYVASDALTVYAIGIGPTMSSIAVSTRRANTRVLTGVDTNGLHFVCPLHVYGSQTPSFDMPVATALVGLRGSSSWSDIFSAIVSFNLANTDGDGMHEQIEGTLLAGVVDRLFPDEIKGGTKRYVQAAQAFSTAFPERSSGWVQLDGIAYRELDSKTRPIFTWMREFYSLRNEFAHGKRKSDRPQSCLLWSVPEHLLLAKLLLPVAFRARFVSAAQHSEIDRDLLTLADDLVSLKHLFRLDAADGSPLRALVGNHRLRAHLSEMT